MIPWRLIIAVAGVVALAAFLAYVVTLIRTDAARDQIDAIKQQNQEAGDAGENARRGRADCVADGMLWDYEHGFCVRAN
ncbi:MAG: hypothetical protein Unbinned2301contig1004_28 [Prokaryotic dsDNA virus sp.]|nr:MAG: hypothetical protein Unbinned2301contig1004_28 [Prokaryotic dsDNA virus sp.]